MVPLTLCLVGHHVPPRDPDSVVDICITALLLLLHCLMEESGSVLFAEMRSILGRAAADLCPVMKSWSRRKRMAKAKGIDLAMIWHGK